MAELFFLPVLLLVIIGLLGGAIAFLAVHYEPVAFKKWRASINEGREQQKAEDEKRWQLFKPLLVSGAVTEFGFNLKRVQYERPFIQVLGPGFEARCVEGLGTGSEKDPQGLVDAFRNIFYSPGTERKDMRRIAAMLVDRIQHDEDVNKTYISHVKNWGRIKTSASSKVIPFRLRA